MQMKSKLNLVSPLASCPISAGFAAAAGYSLRAANPSVQIHYHRRINHHWYKGESSSFHVRSLWPRLSQLWKGRCGFIRGHQGCGVLPAQLSGAPEPVQRWGKKTGLGKAPAGWPVRDEHSAPHNMPVAAGRLPSALAPLPHCDFRAAPQNTRQRCVHEGFLWGASLLNPHYEPLQTSVDFNENKSNTSL